MKQYRNKFAQAIKNCRLPLAIALMGISVAAADASAKKSGGFDGPGPDLVTVEQAKSMRDDAHVSLKGNIIQSLGDETYLFRDATGTIEVEIDNDDWRGVTATPDDVVVISGEIDREWAHASIDVSIVKKP